jgi:hypothetical protein
MSTKTKMVVAAALVLGLASAAQAGSKDDDGGSGGGYRVGPLGQSFDSGATSVYHPSLSGSGRSANAYFELGQPSRPHKKTNNR